MSKHTPTPWGIDQWGAVVEGDGRTTIAAQGFALSGRPAAVANAAFIVKAVNNHDALVAALKMFVWPYQEGCRLTEGERMDAARAALAAVEAA